MTQLPVLPDDEVRRQARALGDPTRHRLFRLVLDASDPIDVVTLTAALGLHHNAVRQHLAKLCAAGLVEETTDAPRGRGRPRLLYQATPGLDGRWGTPDHYVGLATLLADAVSTGTTPRQTGQRAGRAAATAAARGVDGVAVIAAEAERLGFDPSVRRKGRKAEVVLGHCPYHAVAAADPGVVCQLHLGLAEGIAAAVGDVRVVRLVTADPRRAGCRIVLERRPDAP